MCQDCLKRKEKEAKKLMARPIQSPDLNLVELVWSERDRKVKAKLGTSASHLWSMLQECWIKFIGQYVMSLIFPPKCIEFCYNCKKEATLMTQLRWLKLIDEINSLANKCKQLMSIYYLLLKYRIPSIKIFGGKIKQHWKYSKKILV